MDMSAEIARTTLLTEKQALELCALTGSWDEVMNLGGLANKGLTYETLKHASIHGIGADNLSKWLNVTLFTFKLRQQTTSDSMIAGSVINDVIQKLINPALQ